MYHLIEDSGLAPDSPERERVLVDTRYGRRWHWSYTNEGEGETLLQALADGAIFTLTPSEHGPGFRIEEACDEYYHLFLTPAQLYQLGAELQEMARPLIDQPPAAPSPAPSCAPPQPPQDQPA